MAKNQNIIKYKKPLNLNIGLMIFLIVIIYVIFNIFEYLTSSPVSEYEVQQGTIASNHVYQGLILREEEVLCTEQGGYINYYVKGGSKVSSSDVVYSIDTEGNLADEITTAGQDGSQLGEEALSQISEQVDAFTNSYRADQFSYVSTFKNDLDSELGQILNTNALNSLSDQISTAEANNTFYRVAAGTAGLIAYYTDGYENVTVSSFTPELLETADYRKTSLDTNQQVNPQDPVCKLIKSEDWNIILEIPEDLAESLSEGSSIRIRFCKDGFTTTANYSIMKKSGNFYLCLALRTAMIRYFNDRFVNIELVLNDEYGLKIPKSAITSKEFYTVPKEYFTQGGDSGGRGLLIEQSGEDKTGALFVQPTIYYESETAYYIDDEDVHAGDQVLKGDSSQKYTIGTDVDSLVGVYNINKGYAVFKQINITYENEEYAIVEPKTAYGISLYDHIALDGSRLKENDLVVK